MPHYNFTVDDASPSIVYDGAWNDTLSDASTLKNYLGRTAHVTSSVGASATVSFNGTGVCIYGANRPNYGSYTVTVDGEVVAHDSAGGNDAFQVPLFAQANMPYGAHRVVLTNTDASSGLDLDFVNITIGDGKDSTEEHTTILDDVDFIYDANWQDWNPFTQAYLNGTLHLTQTAHAVANIPFTGNAIKLYSATNVDHGPFSLSLDGANPLFLSGRSSDFRPKTLLYQFDGLPDGNHLLRIENLAAMWLDLDQAIVSTYVPVSATAQTDATGTTATQLPASVQTSPVHDPNDTQHLGVTLGLLAIGLPILVLVLAGVLGVLFWRRRAARRVRKTLSLDSDAQQQDGGPVSYGYGQPNGTAVPGAEHPVMSPPPSYVGPNGGSEVLTQVGQVSMFTTRKAPRSS